MSSRSARLRRTAFLFVLLLISGSFGCWEQWSEDWFPQMKWQAAVQAFERPMHQGKVDLFLPAEGTVPIDGGEAPVSNLDTAAATAEANALVNPRPFSMASLENGQQHYEIHCASCHGDKGMGDGPVSMLGEMNGPFAGVLPLTVTAARSDGHIYTTIRYGRRRMPNYSRIASDDRWDIVNYVRYVTGQKGIQ